MSADVLALLQATLNRHPSFSEKLVIPEPLWRRRRRRLFYVLTALALVVAGWTQWELVRLRHERDEAESRARTEGTQRALHTFRQALEETAHVQGVALSTAARKIHVAETVLIGINILIAVRGLQVWSLIRKTGVEGWVQKISMQWPVYERATNIIKWAAAPVRLPLAAVKTRRLGRQLARQQRALAEARRLAHEASWTCKLYRVLRHGKAAAIGRLLGMALPSRWLPS